MPPADAPARRAASGPRWQCIVTEAGRPVRFVFVANERHGDSERVELGGRDAERFVGDDAVAIATYDEDGVVTRLHVTSAFAPAAPPVWFAELRESAARPPAVNLLAFTGAGTPTGAVLDRAALREVPVTSEDQLGAIRWYPGTGEVDQVYVQPAWRRRSVATVLTLGASTLSMARRWPRLWGDGQRTTLGEALRAGSVWRDRTADLTHVAPPMTPGDQPD
ncbi:hypothetical protein [Jatrophihabitans fulvus]